MLFTKCSISILSEGDIGDALPAQNVFRNLHVLSVLPLSTDLWMLRVSVRYIAAISKLMVLYIGILIYPAESRLLILWPMLLQHLLQGTNMPIYRHCNNILCSYHYLVFKHCFAVTLSPTKTSQSNPNKLIP